MAASAWRRRGACCTEKWGLIVEGLDEAASEPASIVAQRGLDHARRGTRTARCGVPSAERAFGVSGRLGRRARSRAGPTRGHRRRGCSGADAHSARAAAEPSARITVVGVEQREFQVGVDPVRGEELRFGSHQVVLTLGVLVAGRSRRRGHRASIDVRRVTDSAGDDLVVALDREVDARHVPRPPCASAREVRHEGWSALRPRPILPRGAGRHRPLLKSQLTEVEAGPRQIGGASRRRRGPPPST